MTNGDRYGFIGGGNMAEALIKGLLESGRAAARDIRVFDPDPARREYMNREYQVASTPDNITLVKDSDVVVLAIKPQQMDDVLEEIGPSVTEDHLLISVAAGVPLSHMQALIPASVPIIRAMPNTPALVLNGASALAPGAFAEGRHAVKARGLFESVGVAVEVDEKYMDVVTGLSGSGPAYVFLMLEAMTDGAVRLGLQRQQARALAVQTVLGAARLAMDSDMHPAQLKDMVASPGGTTAAGLFTLEKNGFRSAVMEAIEKAAARSKELGAK